MQAYGGGKSSLFRPDSRKKLTPLIIEIWMAMSDAKQLHNFNFGRSAKE